MRWLIFSIRNVKASGDIEETSVFINKKGD